MLYYPLPTWLGIIFDRPYRHNAPEIAALICASLVFLWLGFRVSGVRTVSRIPKMSGATAQTLLGVCLLAVIPIIYYWAWRISVGVFFTHTYDVDPTLVDTSLLAGFLGSFAAPLQLPIIIVLGLVAATKPQTKWILIAYSLASALVFAASNQMRTAVTSIIFLLIGLGAAGYKLTLKRAAASGLIIVALFVLLESVRYFSGPSAIETRAGSFVALSVERATVQSQLLSDIMDSIRAGHPYEYGRLMVASLYSLVPRVIWPQKPAVTAMQYLLRQDFNLDVHDDPAGAVLELYANWGWWAIPPGFLFIGVLGGSVTKLAAKYPNSTSLTFALCLWWFIAFNQEQELFLALLSSARIVLICGAMCWVIVKLFALPRSVQSTQHTHVPQ